MKDVIVSSLVTIIGFIISFLGIKRELKNSLHTQRNDFWLKKMDDISEMIDDSILFISDKVERDRKNQFNIELNKKLRTIYKKILPYGSNEDIMIVEKISSAAYFGETLKQKYENYNLYFIANMHLLMCQIKMEMTGIVVNPEVLLRIKYPEYDVYKKKFMNIINDTVNELGLCRKFIIK